MISDRSQIRRGAYGPELGQQVQVKSAIVSNLGEVTDEAASECHGN